MKITLILDLDGVLITTPPWKADEMDTDGYSRFNQNCVDHLNQLLDLGDFEIFLSSTRRTVKTLEDFNQIFAHRKIHTQITGFLPVYDSAINRKQEIELFIAEKGPQKFMIIDDDKSLNDLPETWKKFLVHTELMTGFNKAGLEKAVCIFELTD